MGPKPRPPSFSYETARIERTSGAPVCSMRRMGICLAPKGTDDGANVRVTMHDSGRGEPSVYYLCGACAAASNGARIP